MVAARFERSPHEQPSATHSNARLFHIRAAERSATGSPNRSSIKTAASVSNKQKRETFRACSRKKRTHENSSRKLGGNNAATRARKRVFWEQAELHANTRINKNCKEPTQSPQTKYNTCEGAVSAILARGGVVDANSALRPPALLRHSRKKLNLCQGPHFRHSHPRSTPSSLFHTLATIAQLTWVSGDRIARCIRLFFLFSQSLKIVGPYYLLDFDVGEIKR